MAISYDENLEPLRILSMGWGVQSFTIACMSALGELPKLDYAIHSDTGYESKLTYAFSRKYTPWLEEHGIKIVTTHGTSGDTDEIFNKMKNGKLFACIPVFQANVSGSGTSMLRRQCTSKWKIRPIRRVISNVRKRHPVIQVMGISYDEMERMRSSDLKYLTYEYPLVNRKITRQDCVIWLEKNKIDVPPKSACVFCPYHSTQKWAHTKLIQEDWEIAVKVDNLIRDYDIDKKSYLNMKLLPLEELDLSKYDDYDFIECSGTCWV